MSDPISATRRRMLKTRNRKSSQTCERVACRELVGGSVVPDVGVVDGTVIVASAGVGSVTITDGDVPASLRDSELEGPTFATIFKNIFSVGYFAFKISIHSFS